VKILIQKLPKSKIELKIELSPREFDDFIEKAIFNLGRDFEIEGFRKGKVPKEIIREKIGLGKILEESADLAVKESYVRAILENKIEAIGRPEIQITKIAENNPFEFKADVSVLPEINLPDYKVIAARIKRKEGVVEEKEIEEAIIWLQKSRAKFIFKKQPAKIGNFVEIEFQSSQIEGGQIRKDGFILGEGHFVSGFEENLEGMAAGEEKNFSLKFPEDYFQETLAGKEVIFKVKMDSVKIIELPEINDAFLKNLGSFENLTTLKESIKEGIKKEKEIAESLRIRQEILKKIAESSSFETPDILIEEEKNRILENFKKKVSENLKIPFEEYLNKIKKAEKDIKESFVEEAQKNIRDYLILRKITKREKIEASKEEIENEINKVLKELPMEKAKEFDLEKLKMYIESEVRQEKTLKFLESLVR